MIGLINKIPGVNIPIVPKVDWSGVDNKPTSGAEFRKLEGSYAVGSNRIQQDHAAMVHKDEMIIPARQAQRVRAAGGTINNIDKLVTGPSKATPVANTTNNQTNSPVIHMVVNANQLSYDDVVHRLSKDISLALSNM